MKRWGPYKTGSWSASIPFYVTRKTAAGDTGELSISIWMQLLVVLLAWVNAVMWGFIGIWKAGAVIF